jgi:hypothetical protein
MKILPALLLATISTATLADTSLTFTGKKDKVVMKMQFAHNMMRATSVSDDSTYMVYDANNTTFTTFDGKNKKYYVMDKESIEALGDIGAMMDKMLEKQLAQMPESQREMMRGMLEGALKAQMPKQMPKPEYSFTGKTASYNGFDCQIVSKKSKRKKSNFCVTEYSNLGMSSDEYAIIASFQKTIEGLAQQYGQDNSMDFTSLGDYLPVSYKQAGESGILSKVSHEKLSTDLFSIPEGYSQIEMPF